MKEVYLVFQRNKDRPDLLVQVIEKPEGVPLDVVLSTWLEANGLRNPNNFRLSSAPVTSWQSVVNATLPCSSDAKTYLPL